MVRSFAVLAEEGHVGRAAQRLFVSQPALSKRIRRLEELLEVKLVRPEGRGIALTAAGDALAEALPPIIGAVDDAINLTRAADRATAMKVVVGFVAPMPAPLTTGLVRMSGPELGIDIRLQSITWDQQVSAVASGQVDIALVRGPVDAPSGIVAVTVLSEPRVAALAADHPLAARRSLDLSDFDTEPIVVTAPNTEFWTVDPRPSGNSPVLGPTATTVAEILERVASGRAMALPARSLAEQNARPDVAYVPVRGLEPSPIVAVWSAGTAGEAVPRVIDLIRTNAAECEADS